MEVGTGRQCSVEIGYRITRAGCYLGKLDGHTHSRMHRPWRGRHAAQKRTSGPLYVFPWSRHDPKL
eukprot:1671642-Alexandrium_andersonii.AAC.1